MIGPTSLKSRIRQRARTVKGAVRAVRAVRAFPGRIADSRIGDLAIEALRRVPMSMSTFGPPKGTFSAYDLLKRGEVEGEVLLERQEFAPIPPDAMRIVSGLNQHRHQPWPIFWTRHDDARLTASTLVLIDRSKRACLEAMYVEHHPKDPAFRSVWLPPPKELGGNWTSIVSRWTRSTNFYHWFTDALPRLALLDRLPPDTGVLPAHMEPFQVETLRWMGLEARFRPTAETHLVVGSYLFSSPTAMTGGTNPYAVRFLRDRVPRISDDEFRGPSKIYVVRRGKTRGVVNEDEVVTFLERRGWTAVDPESLSLTEQIRLFAGASAICGVHGAGLTNILWCSPGCTVIELIASNYLNGCFESISSCLDVRHRYLVFPGDRESRIHVDLDRLASALQA